MIRNISPSVRDRDRCSGQTGGGNQVLELPQRILHQRNEIRRQVLAAVGASDLRPRSELSLRINET